MLVLIHKADDFLASVEKVILTVFSGALVLILMTQVILRYGFSRPLFWAEEICVQLLVFITLIGLSLLLKSRQMIAIDMVISALPRRVKSVVALALQVASLAVIVFFAYQGTLWILRPEARLQISPTTGLPIWINYAMFPLTFYWMTIHLAARLVAMILNTKNRD